MGIRGLTTLVRKNSALGDVVNLADLPSLFPSQSPSTAASTDIATSKLKPILLLDYQAVIYYLVRTEASLLPVEERSCLCYNSSYIWLGRKLLAFCQKFISSGYKLIVIGKSSQLRGL